MELYKTSEETINEYNRWVEELLASSRNHEANGNIACARKALAIASLITKEISLYYNAIEAAHSAKDHGPCTCTNHPPNCS